MKKIITFLIVLLTTSHSSFTQVIEELCEENTDGFVVAMREFNGTIYGAGFFEEICGEEASYLAEWNGTNWEASELALSDANHSMKQIGDKLYFANYRRSANDTSWLYVYDGTSIEKFGDGFIYEFGGGNWPNIYDVVEFQGDIYVSGEFNRAGGNEILGIARWDGNEWIDVGGGLKQYIPGASVIYPHSMLVFNDELYVAGNFRKAGELDVYGLAKWNGTEWADLDGGFNSTVYGIGVYNDEIYAGGDFTGTQNGEVDLNAFAKWNEETGKWESPGFGFAGLTSQDYTFVHTITQIDTMLIVAGGLKNLVYDDGTEEVCNAIVAFDGTNVNTFEGGLEGQDVEAVALTPEGDLLIGGGVWEDGYWGIAREFLLPYEIETSNQNLDENVHINIAPNPFKDNISVEASMNILKLSLSDLSGKTIDLPVNDRIDLSFLQTGVYLLQVTTKNSVTTHKIMKE